MPKEESFLNNLTVSFVYNNRIVNANFWSYNAIVIMSVWNMFFINYVYNRRIVDAISIYVIFDYDCMGYVL